MTAMMRRVAAGVLLAMMAVASARAEAIDRRAVLAQLCGTGAAESLAGLRLLLDAAPGLSPADAQWGLAVAAAFSGKALHCGANGEAVLTGPGGTVDAATLQTGALPADSRAPLPSLRARVVLEQVSAALTLFADTPARDRLAAVRTLGRRSDGLPANLVPAALERAHDPAVVSALRDMQAEAGLHAADPQRRIDAIRTIGDTATSATATRLRALRADPAFSADPAVSAALDGAIARVDRRVAIGNALSLLYNGISAGSVLFMSAVGLAIIFGLMGVINLAQGELIMLGAYVTYCVQQALVMAAPAWVDWYPLLAIPVVFVITGAAGVVIELAVIRHLYQRPLMTLLATWAISLLLINLVRVGFGTQNLQFMTPPWLRGGVNLVGDFLVTWNHLFAIGFAALALLATAALLRLTDLGLFIRAVTQNRGMAGCVGISSRRIDMAAFGFGAGLAGLGGLALSPIYNVNPTMGTGFIIDSFMVVVLGGVGSLAGTALASLGVGLVNVGIEPYYGAVAAKVIALLLIILIIQWRPEGLVATRGRR
ncbi:MAG: urea ABC transporter permease subunit UrtB [Acetobacteraceae bacterium]|nr:urea ABC transporter permease subunit UrtB [Acetobacteraceae bacterium]